MYALNEEQEFLEYLRPLTQFQEMLNSKDYLLRSNFLDAETTLNHGNINSALSTLKSSHLRVGPKLISGNVELQWQKTESTRLAVANIPSYFNQSVYKDTAEGPSAPPSPDVSLAWKEKSEIS